MTLAARVRCVLFIYVVCFVVLISAVLLRTSHTLAREAAWKQLDETAHLLLPLVERGAPSPGSLATSPVRVTLVDAVGKSRWDTQSDLRQPVELRNRPEVAAALRGAPGRAEHFSPQLNEDMLYLALPLRDRAGKVKGALRVALSTSSIGATATTMERYVLLGALLALVLAALVAECIAAFLWRPLERLSSALLQNGTDVALPDEGPVEVRRLVAALNEAHARLRDVDRMRCEFVDNASHELRTPVGALAAALEVVERDTHLPAEERDAFIRRARRQAERLRRLADDLLDLSGTEEPRCQPVLAPAEAVYECSELAERFLSAAAERGQSLNLVLPRALAYVDMAANDLVRVVGNVLDNALKYSPAHSQVELRLRLDDTSLEIAVSDEGAGIPPGDLERIFERFYRVDKARSREAGGAGLGLSIARHLVTRAGGRMWAENGEHGGARICLRLPLHHAALAYAAS